MISSLILYWALSTVACLGFIALGSKKITLLDLVAGILTGWLFWWLIAMTDGVDAVVIWRKGDK